MTTHKAEALCVNVIDGDTIEVRWRHRRRKVRLLGIDTPETHNHAKRKKQADRFGFTNAHLLRVGRLATRMSHDAMHEQRVELIFPERIGHLDQYGRLLCYVHLLDGSDVGAELLSNGLAFPRKDYHPRRSQYFDCVKTAKDRKAGLFSRRK